MNLQHIVIQSGRALIVVGFGALAFYLGAAAWCSARAFDQHHQAHIAMEAWAGGKIEPSRKVWVHFHDILQDAIDTQPSNAAFLNTMGRMYLYRGVKLERHKVASAVYLLKSKAWFSKAARSRPAWPYPWLNMVTVGVLLSQWDVEYSHAFNMAMQQGRWEENTMPALVELGLKLYPKFNAAERQRFRSYLATAMEERAQHLSWLKHNRKMGIYACSLVAGNGKLPEFCQ